MRIAIRIEELVPIILEHIKKKYGIKDDIELVYTSKTTFLTFDVVEE